MGTLLGALLGALLAGLRDKRIQQFSGHTSWGAGGCAPSATIGAENLTNYKNIENMKI